MDPDARSGRAAGRRLAEGLQKACRRLAEAGHEIRGSGHAIVTPL